MGIYLKTNRFVANGFRLVLDEDERIIHELTNFNEMQARIVKYDLVNYSEYDLETCDKVIFYQGKGKVFKTTEALIKFIVIDQVTKEETVILERSGSRAISMVKFLRRK